MTNQPTPRRMKANHRKAGPLRHHAEEHDWDIDCAWGVPCLPVDAPVEPRTSQSMIAPRDRPHPFKNREGRPYCSYCGRTEQHEVHATPPPASAPGTPVERWLTHDEVFDIKFPFTAELKVRRIIERLCALLDTWKAVADERAKTAVRCASERDEQRTRAEKAELALTEGRHLRDQSAQRVMERMQAKLDQQEADLAAAREALERISNDQPNGPTIARETLGKLKGTPMKTEHTKEPIPTVEWKAKAERLESILTCTEKPLPPGCARTRYALEEKLVKATDLLKLAVDRLEQAYVASEQHLGATPARSWEVAANGVRKFREGIASLDARAALAENKE